MKEHKIRFIERGLLFLAILLSLVLILNMIYINTVQEKKQIYRKEAIYNEYINNLSAKEIDYAFFGDSHTRQGINPMFINGSFNFGTSAEDYIETYYKLKKILEKDDITINNIVLEVDLHTFSHKLRMGERLFRDIPYYAQFVPLNDMAQLKNQNVNLILIQKYFPVVGNGKDWFNSPKTPSMSIHLGWTNNTGNFSLSDQSKIANETYKSHFNKDNPNEIEKTSFEYFLNVLEIAKNNDINVIFIKYPLTKAYDDVVNENNITKNENYEFIFANVNDTLGENYMILDYYDVFFEHTEYFYNSDHLNYIGAKKLSEKVQSDLI